MIHHIPLLATLITSVVAVTTTPNTGDQTNGFLFDYLRSYPAPLPVIESCPAQLQFAPVTVPFGGAEPAPPFTAMYVSSPPCPSANSLFKIGTTERGVSAYQQVPRE
jgi:hypothetical protein